MWKKKREKERNSLEIKCGQKAWSGKFQKWEILQCSKNKILWSLLDIKHLAKSGEGKKALYRGKKSTLRGLQRLSSVSLGRDKKVTMFVKSSWILFPHAKWKHRYHDRICIYSPDSQLSSSTFEHYQSKTHKHTLCLCAFKMKIRVAEGGAIMEFSGRLTNSFCTTFAGKKNYKWFILCWAFWHHHL